MPVDETPRSPVAFQNSTTTPLIQIGTREDPST